MFSKALFISLEPRGRTLKRLGPGFRPPPALEVPPGAALATRVPKLLGRAALELRTCRGPGPGQLPERAGTACEGRGEDEHGSEVRGHHRGAVWRRFGSKEVAEAPGPGAYEAHEGRTGGVAWLLEAPLGA